MVATQEALRNGARRRVGNGKDINIIGDPWLPCPINPCISSVHPSLHMIKVATLMQMDSLAWDIDVVRDLFNDRDLSLILNIPLMSSRCEDKWFWAFESSGNFSVKSLYRVLQTSALNLAPDSQVKIWKAIWKLRVPPKVRAFIWRAASGCLPTRSQLHEHHVPIIPICPICGEATETILHCLILCRFASYCWVSAGFIFLHHFEGDFFSWMASSFSDFDEHQKSAWAILCWALWTSRNRWVWQQKRPSSACVLFLARKTGEQWLKAQDHVLAPPVE